MTFTEHLAPAGVIDDIELVTWQLEQHEGRPIVSSLVCTYALSDGARILGATSVSNPLEEPVFFEFAVDGVRLTLVADPRCAMIDEDTPRGPAELTVEINGVIRAFPIFVQ